MVYWLIAIGSAIGGTLRYWLSGWIGQIAGQSFPWGTLAINITGSFAIGLFSTLTGPGGRMIVPVEWRHFFMIGVCGGYTTFSSFSLQTLNLMQDGRYVWAGVNIGLSVILCLLGVWLGHAGAVLLNR